MDTFYTLDRCLSLKTGMQLTLAAPQCPVIPLQSHATMMLPDGISRHAENYFLNLSVNLVNSDERYSAIIEMMLEDRRRSCFPEKPSRFQSIFACESVKDVTWFRGYSRAPIATPIFEIHSTTNCHRGDMNLLNMNCPPLELSRRLDLYWRGETDVLWDNYTPFWEVLISLPATVGNVVQE